MLFPTEGNGQHPKTIYVTASSYLLNGNTSHEVFAWSWWTQHSTARNDNHFDPAFLTTVN
jgi:hypothetical protein